MAKPKGDVVSATEVRKYERYKELEIVVQSEYAKAVGATGRYWMALHEMWRNRLWEARRNFKSQDEWIGSMKGSMYGPSRTQFLQVMKVVELMLGQGMSRPEAEFAIGTNRAAIVYDINKWFDRSGKKTYTLKPDVAARLENDGTTFGESVMQLASLSAPEARDMVSITSGQKQTYIHAAAWIDDVYAAQVVVRENDGRIRTIDIQVTLSKPDDDVRSFIEGRFK